MFQLLNKVPIDIIKTHNYYYDPMKYILLFIQFLKVKSMT